MLWTSSEKNRVQAILDYYKICNSFKIILFSDKLIVKQDIEKICELFECDYEELVFYEDNDRVIEELQQLSIEVIPVRFQECL